jgi:plastocyanin
MILSSNDPASSFSCQNQVRFGNIIKKMSLSFFPDIFQKGTMPKFFISLTLLLLSFGLSTQMAQAKFGWADADMVLDFGIDLEPGGRHIIVDQAEVGHPFHVDVVWKLHPHNCLIQTLQDKNGDGTSEWQMLEDDQLFDGTPTHAIASDIEALAVTAKKDHPCLMDTQKDEVLVVSQIEDPKKQEPKPMSKTPLGATVMVLRATSFFTPNVVTIKAGERVVWIYADGAKEPHTATSGACRGTDCTGGGNIFDSGKTLNQPGQKFEHVFNHSGTFPYHCDLHTASMTGTVIVK